MKIRTSFVSNSSSSSFVCEICGTTEGGWDLSYSEAGFVYCGNGHEICDSHILNEHILHARRAEAEELLFCSPYDSEYGMRAANGWQRTWRPAKETDPEEYKDWMARSEEERQEILTMVDEGSSWIPTSHCPICQLEELGDAEMLQLLLLSLGKTKLQVLEAITKKVGDYDGLKSYLQQPR